MLMRRFIFRADVINVILAQHSSKITEMEFKVVPFTAQITRNDTSTTVAEQMQSIIDANGRNGWDYLRMDSVQTSIAATNGCFGLGAQPGFTTTYNVLVFKK